MRTVAILPIKRFARAKQRLRDVLDDGPRAQLAQATARGAHVVDDHDEAGQSAAVALGVLAAREVDAQRALLVPGDTPGLSAGDLDALLARREPVVIVPDRHGTGTNAL